jgi:hypothetical protein
MLAESKNKIIIVNFFLDLIEKLLEKDPIKRIHLNEIKQHIWFNREIPSKKEVLKEMRARALTILQCRLFNHRRDRYFPIFDSNKREKLHFDTDYERAIRQYTRKTNCINKNLDSKKINRLVDERSSSENITPRNAGYERYGLFYKKRSHSENRWNSKNLNVTIFEIG